jgi:hypothetical protein
MNMEVLGARLISRGNTGATGAAASTNRSITMCLFLVSVSASRAIS